MFAWFSSLFAAVLRRLCPAFMNSLQSEAVSVLNRFLITCLLQIIFNVYRMFYLNYSWH